MGAAEHRDGLTTSKRDETDETDEADEGDETHVGLHNSRDFAVTARYTTRSRAPRAPPAPRGCPRGLGGRSPLPPDPIIDFESGRPPFQASSCARTPRAPPDPRVRPRAAVWAGGHLTPLPPFPLLTSSRGGRHFRRRRALARKIQQQMPAAQISEITRLLKYTVSRRVTRIFTRDPPRE